MIHCGVVCVRFKYHQISKSDWSIQSQRALRVVKGHHINLVEM